MSQRVHCLLAPGFEEIEMVTLADFLRRAGAEVPLVSLNDQSQVQGRCDMTIHADVRLAAVTEKPSISASIMA